MNKSSKMSERGLGLELPVNRLLTEEEILEECKHFSMDGACGVYFLVKDGKISYIGQSTNIYSRLAAYKRHIDFDKFCFVRCEKKNLNLLESIYIHFLRPPMNKADKKKRHAPLAMDAILSRIQMKDLEEVENEDD